MNSQTYQKAFSSGMRSSNKPAKKFMACTFIETNKIRKGDIGIPRKFKFIQ